VDEYHNELDHLEHSQVFLPPEVLLHLWSNSGQHVVRVHNDVYESIEQSKERAVTARCELDAKPYTHRHDSVVNDVQGRHLIVFLTHNEKEGVEEFREF